MDLGAAHADGIVSSDIVGYSTDSLTGCNFNMGGITFTTAGTSGSPTYFSAGAAAVPEPTSGLLMLLGMAGLALRRRRA